METCIDSFCFLLTVIKVLMSFVTDGLHTALYSYVLLSWGMMSGVNFIYCFLRFTLLVSLYGVLHSMLEP
jgi:hypothetical protein